ncbi:hypothetical protein H4J46_12800 [Colwellia sp. MB02u-6]|uniref:hypothetical protein n=1 Tax=Colwellia sp. MB02u-6 TaxID=2759824 RepID=UPI0015F6C5CE|nr:hypothetical protein [Colwellia sp. MB02u-6]MBA6328803.1 hypothetical protein [Colwellia sp. MB02u-6]
MLKNFSGDTKFTTKVKILLTKIYGTSPLKDSVLERAIAFYDLEFLSQGKIKSLNNEMAKLLQIDSDKSNKRLLKLEREHQESLKVLSAERNVRAQHLQGICRDILELCEGESLAVTKRKSAELLGTIQLLLPTEGSKVAVENERSKPLYKAVLALRLLDQICLKKLSSKDPLAQELVALVAFDFNELLSGSAEALRQFTDLVKIPVLMAAILQDIGHYHPNAQKIIQGIDGKLDCFRILELEERKALLEINYRETIKYLLHGIGMVNYLGDSVAEREAFDSTQTNILRFVKQLIMSSFQPKLGVGNILKIPQIYTGIVLSTKNNYNYKLLPRVYQALYKNAVRGRCSRQVVDALYQITGDFPQGFGVIYIPNDVDQDVRYEYAIVTQLYPEKSNEPKCRIASRQLTFIGHGHDLVVKKSNNLYFVETAQKCSNISKARLDEILPLLSSNYLERKELDLLPRCWQPGEYFFNIGNQKLWSRAR